MVRVTKVFASTKLNRDDENLLKKVTPHPKICTNAARSRIVIDHS
jgi:hypothetical protein